jgi:predicted amidohydrolase
MSVRVGLLQLRVDDSETVADRKTRVVELVSSVLAGQADGLARVGDVGATQSLDVLVLPELWTVGAHNSAIMLAHPEPLDGELIAGLCALACSSHTWIYAGSFPEVDGSQRFNTTVVINDEGVVVGRYRKIHLFGFDSGEAAVLTPGPELVVIDSPLGATGSATCYDLRFPELFRGLLERGAESFVIPSGWPTARIDHWRTLLTARAIENLAWTFGCNQVGDQAGVELGGASLVIDPWGQVIAEAPTDEECLLLAEVDLSLVTRSRDAFPALKDRKL